MTEFACPLPSLEHRHIVMGHGGGGRLMHQLIDAVFKPRFDNPHLAQGHDGAVVELAGVRVAFTTDAHVVHPLFFPGGDIGKLAVCGTVNDLAMCGARPLFLSVAFVLEEGLDLSVLERVAESVRCAAEEANVQVVTGDTKVVERGKCDGLYLTTAGLGLVEHQQLIVPASVRPGDAIVLSGDVGRHGIAVLGVREGMGLDPGIASDVASVWPLVRALLDARVEVHCMRDLTRGGLASALNEIALASGWQCEVMEDTIPVLDNVRGACELLGLDPLYVACEGRFVAFVPGDDAERAVALLRHVPGGENACVIGRVLDKPARGQEVIVVTRLGVRRILDMPLGEQLPRIC